MLRNLLLLSLLFQAFVDAQAPPPSLTVRNAASISNVVAPGSFLALFSFVSARLDLARSSAELAVQGGRFTLTLRRSPNDAYLWALIPDEAPLGPASITLYENGTAIGTAAFEIAAVAPALFSKDYNGSGPALALTYLGSNATRNALTAAAVPEHYVALFGAGLNHARLRDVTVEVAGQSIAPTFAGPQGSAGLDQINFVLPKDVYQGCYVPVAIRVRGTLSNTLTLSINRDTAACAHPLGLSYSELKTLDDGGTLPFIGLSLSRSNPAGTWVESTNLLISEFNAAGVAAQAGIQEPVAQTLACKPAQPGGVLGVFWTPAPNELGTVRLDGPGGKQLEIPSPYIREVTPPEPHFFDPGVWEFSASGGSGTFSFGTSFVVPPGIEAINIAPGSTLSSDRDIEVTWDPRGFTANDLVTVTLAGQSCGAYGFMGRVILPKPANTRGERLLGVAVTAFPPARQQFSFLRRSGTQGHGLANHYFNLMIPVTLE